MSIILFIGRKSTRTVDPLRKGHSYHLMLSVFSLLLISCAAERDPGSLFGPAEQGTLVVDATLIVDRPMPPIFIRQTIAPNVVYTQNAAAVNTAEVIITQGSSEYKYLPDPISSLGRYLPPVAPPFILPETEYRILVRFGGKEARAVTTSPKRFTIDQAFMIDVKTLDPVRDLITFRDNPNTVFTAPVNQVPYLENLIETRFQPINVKAYQVGIINLETDSDFVISGDFLDEEDFDNFERKSSSPPLEVADGNLRLPWFAIAFAGRHIIKVFAMDDNWFDFARSSPETQNVGFGNLAGDNFERPIFHIDGGIGLFGSASVDSVGFVILPPK